MVREGEDGVEERALLLEVEPVAACRCLALRTPSHGTKSDRREVKVQSRPLEL